MYRKTLIAIFSFFILITNSLPAIAHQPVILLNTDTTPAKGPLLLDGTVSFAVRATFTKSGEKRAFRAAFKEGDTLTLQYLILDKKPENSLKVSQLPQVSLISPKGKVTLLKINERTNFYEPFSKSNYLFLSRYQATADSGIYGISITSKSRAMVTIAIGDREVTGEVIRGTITPTPNPTPSSTPSPTPSPTATQSTISSPTPTTSPSKSGYTMDQVKANNGASSCWSVIDGDVYDLTKWISSHPGGAAAIKSLCGLDGTSAFKAQHEGQNNPIKKLITFLLGPLKK